MKSPGRPEAIALQSRYGKSNRFRGEGAKAGVNQLIQLLGKFKTRALPTSSFSHPVFASSPRLLPGFFRFGSLLTLHKLEERLFPGEAFLRKAIEPVR
jgi:hypothetical protein